MGWAPGLPPPHPGHREGAGLSRPLPVLTFSPVRVTMSRGPYMNRPVRTCGPSSLATASLIRWLAVTFWEEEGQGWVRVGDGGAAGVSWAPLKPPTGLWGELGLRPENPGSSPAQPLSHVAVGKGGSLVALSCLSLG